MCLKFSARRTRHAACKGCQSTRNTHNRNDTRAPELLRQYVHSSMFSLNRRGSDTSINEIGSAPLRAAFLAFLSTLRCFFSSLRCFFSSCAPSDQPIVICTHTVQLMVTFFALSLSSLSLRPMAHTLRTSVSNKRNPLCRGQHFTSPQRERVSASMQTHRRSWRVWPPHQTDRRAAIVNCRLPRATLCTRAHWRYTLPWTRPSLWQPL